MAFLQLTPTTHTLQVTVADALDNPVMVKAAAESLSRSAANMEGVKPKVRACLQCYYSHCVHIHNVTLIPILASCACTTETPPHRTATPPPPRGAAQSD